MEQFILGFPKNATPGVSSITQYTTLQDAGNACNDFVGTYADSLDKAKDKFIELATRNFLTIKKKDNEHKEKI